MSNKNKLKFYLFERPRAEIKRYQAGGRPYNERNRHRCYHQISICSILDYRARKIEMAGNRLKQYDKEYKNHTDDKVKRAAKAGNDFRGIFFFEIREACPESDWYPGKPDADDYHCGGVQEHPWAGGQEHHIGGDDKYFADSDRADCGKQEFSPENPGSWDGT